MKKWFRILTLSVLLLFLCGCSSSGYRYLEKDGLSCIKVSGSSNSVSSNSTGMRPMPELCFQSFEEMRDDIVTGNFTEKELENLQRMSIRGFCQLPINVYSPPVPVFPEYWVIEREYIRFADNEFQIRYTKGDLEVTFEYGLNENNIDSNKKYPGIFEWPYYVLTDGPKTLYVTEDVRDTYNILYAHYDINGFEFMITFEHSGSNKKRPSDPELLGINIEYLDLKT